MTELAPCVACKRHFAIGEVTCPFCAAALPPRPAQRFVPRSLARAAIFSAALAACSDPEPSTPVPAKGSAASNADDLEKLLDNDGTTVQRPTPADAATPDAAQVAAAVDAGVPDAGVDPQVLAAKKREAERRRRERQRQLELQRQQVNEQKQLQERMMHNAKPYGAPPARKRFV